MNGGMVVAGVGDGEREDAARSGLYAAVGNCRDLVNDVLTFVSDSDSDDDDDDCSSESVGARCATLAGGGCGFEEFWSDSDPDSDGDDDDDELVSDLARLLRFRWRFFGIAGLGCVGPMKIKLGLGLPTLRNGREDRWNRRQGRWNTGWA
jgi:hypothetical protein